MESAFSSTRLVFVRLLLVAAVAVGHCCLMGHTAWAADVHGGDLSAHMAPGQAPSVQWQPLPAAPMVCDGAHAVMIARPALPAPSSVAMPMMAASVLGSGTRTSRPVLAYRGPPDAPPPSRSTLQIFLI